MTEESVRDGAGAGVACKMGYTRKKNPWLPGSLARPPPPPPMIKVRNLHLAGLISIRCGDRKRAKNVVN